MPIEFYQSQPDEYSSYNPGKHLIKINTNETSPYQMILAHEIGHCLDDTVRPRNNACDIVIFREELKAWRIAKSIIKLRLWDKNDALKSLKAYAKFLKNNGNPINVDWDKLQILSLNKGIKFNKF